MFLKSLQWRLVFIFISITIVLVSVVGIVMNYKVEDWHYTNFKKGIEAGFSDKAWVLKENPTSDQIYRFLVTESNAIFIFRVTETKTYTIVNWKENKVVYSYYDKYDNSDINELLSSDNYISALAGRTGDRKKLMHYQGSSYFDYAKPMGDFIIYFRYDKDEWKGIVSDFNNFILSSAIMATIASLIVGYILSKTITVPIVNIMYKAEKIASGEFDNALEVNSEDEIGKLTQTFNLMSRELKNKIAEISSEKNKIETILNYMTDGVIAFRIDGGVIHANPVSLEMLGETDISFSFNEFCSKYDMDISVEEVLFFESASSKEKDIITGDRYIKVYFAVFTDEVKKVEGIIAVLHDVTEQQKLENMRKDFVANVSHELRTPLTSIKSYAETLLDGALDDRETSERFLSVIDSEADRMTRLVKDLLQLSRLDNQQMQWNMSRISFESLVKGAVVKLEMEAENKEQTLECYVIGEIPDIHADKDRIEQVVLNVLSNAIKYTPQGGNITVYIGRIYSDVYVKISDTGIGIPSEDISRIFERFYRVDKARSREMGGTGLGLSIAREIVEAHGGSISAVSELDKGTEITVRLPVGKAQESD